jgi:hypothetical protein
MESHKLRISTVFMTAAAAASGSFAVYLATFSRSVGWHDSAELALTAWSMGASHAPGSPLHTVVGNLLTHFFTEPFIGTTLLSSLASAGAVACLAVLLLLLGKDALVSVLTAFIYAFSFQVWASAVVTEIYALSMMFLAAALVLAWRWCASGRDHYLYWLLFAYGLALASYFANILLLPAFAFLILSASERRVRDLAIFSVAVLAAVLVTGAANFMLAQNLAPFGEIYPDSVVNMLLYMSGAQHDPLQIRDAGFLLNRLLEHGGIFTRSVAYVGVPLALLGAWTLLRQQRIYGTFLLLVFLIYVGYYTLFGPGDYFMMILPAYFVCSVWIGMGVGWIGDRLGAGPFVLMCRLLPAVLVAGLLVVQLEGRRAMAHALDAEEFVAATARALPDDAIVIVGWREFATLRYFQTVHGELAGHRYIVPARTVRRYQFGEVTDYLEAVAAAVCQTPVFTHKDLPELAAEYHLEPVAAGGEWLRVTVTEDSSGISCAGGP